jgi:hypothetical protein
VGAGVVARWPRRRIQMGMGIALFIAAALLAMTLANRNPPAERSSSSRDEARARVRRQRAARRLDDARHRAVRAVHDHDLPVRHGPEGGVPDHDGFVRVPHAGASARFVRERSFDLRASLGLLLGGIPAVLIAASHREVVAAHGRAMARARRGRCTPRRPGARGAA